jgi:hypothetical protein
MGKIIGKLSVLYSFCLTVFIICCRPIRSTRDSFQHTQYCYNGSSTGLDTLLDLSGYYSFGDSYISHKDLDAIPEIIKSPYNCYFSSHGDFVGSYSTSAGGGLWGSYIIRHDTIMAQFIEPPGGMSWSKGEIWFKIIDKKTLRRIGLSNVSMTKTDIEDYKLKKAQEYNTLGHLTHYSNLPDVNSSWLKKREWFWCDKYQYRKWRKGLKHNTQDK